MRKAFKVTAGNWRGIGRLDDSALQLKDSLAEFDARKKYNLKPTQGKDIHTGCQCHQVISRQNQTQPMPPVPKNLHPSQTRRSLHGQQRRHLPCLGKKRRRKHSLTFTF